MRAFFAMATAACAGLALTACQTVPEYQPESTPPEVIPSEPVAPPLPEISLAAAIDLLQRGREPEALAVLNALESADSGTASTAARLRRQIEAPVEELIPGPYRTITVNAGETLSEIAQRELGDSLMFYALARLNALPEPRLVGAGASLRVPAQGAASEATAAPDTETAPAAASRAQDIDTVAGYLARSGRPEEAWQMLLLEVESGGASPALEESLAELTLARVGEMQRQDRFDEATETISRALAALAPDSARRASLTRRLDEVRTEAWMAAARKARAEGDRVEAYRLSRQAQASMNSPAADALVRELRGELVDGLHNDALIAWRDRDVDQAIRLWEALLEAVPDFEPAKVYLARARELRGRLDEP